MNVVGVFVVSRQRVDQRQRLIGRQTLGGRSQLAADSNVRFRLGDFNQLASQRNRRSRFGEAMSHQMRVLDFTRSRHGSASRVRSGGEIERHVAAQPHGPLADERFFVREALLCERVVESSELIDRPQTFERELAGARVDVLFQQRQHGSIAALADEPQSRLTLPLVRLLKVLDQFGGRLLSEVGWLRRRRVLR